VFHKKQAFMCTLGNVLSNAIKNFCTHKNYVISGLNRISLENREYIQHSTQFIINQACCVKAWADFITSSLWLPAVLI